MIMTMAATKTMIITMATSTTMTKNIATNMATIFKQIQKENFYYLLKMIKKVTKIQFALLLKKPVVFFITPTTKFIGSTLYC